MWAATFVTADLGVPGLELSQLGVAAAVVVVLLAGFGLILTRKLRTEGEFKERDELNEKRYAEMTESRDEWREIAKALPDAVDRLGDINEKQNAATAAQNEAIREGTRRIEDALAAIRTDLAEVARESRGRGTGGR